MDDLVAECRDHAVYAQAVIRQRQQDAAIQYFLALLVEEPAGIGHWFFEIHGSPAE